MKTTFKYGDRIRHLKRPEWGVGSVMKVEDVRTNGVAVQSLTVRFPSHGIKRLTSEAQVEAISSTDANGVEPPLHGSNGAAAAWKQIDDGDWLAPVAQRKIQEVMTALPEEASDPFNSITQRLIFTLNLYRFDKSGRGLIDWAVAQCGLDDPLSRFSRQDLEQLFDRWMTVREAHLQPPLAGSGGNERRSRRSRPPRTRRRPRRHAAVVGQRKEAIGGRIAFCRFEFPSPKFTE